MGLIAGIVVAVGTLLWVVLLLGANSMSDAPSQSGLSIWPSLVIGWGIAAVLIFTHYHPIGW